jgi:hypothetical protein
MACPDRLSLPDVAMLRKQEEQAAAVHSCFTLTCGLTAFDLRGWFVPGPDSCTAASKFLFDHLVPARLGTDSTTIELRQGGIQMLRAIQRQQSRAAYVD